MCAVIFPFIRHLVLISFTFTALFPSWAWAMEDLTRVRSSTFSSSAHMSHTISDTFLEEDEHLVKDGKSDKPLLSNQEDDENTRTWHRFLKKVIGQDKTTSSFLFGIGIDTSDNLLSDETANSHQFALPTDFSFSNIQTFFHSQSEIQAHYKGLSLTTSGLTWQSKGYEFILDFSGDLTFYAQDKSIVDYAYTESLRVNNPYGDIYIGAEVPSQHLQVSAQNVFYQTPASPLERLDIWALGVDKTKGIACISAASHLKTREIYQHQGKFFNNGTLHNETMLILSLKEGGMNTGIITSNGTMTFTTEDTFVNHKTIASSRNMVLSGKGALQNQDIISTRGTLSGTLNSLVNSTSGTITTIGGFSHFYVKSLVNEGTLSGSGFIRVGKGYNRNILTSGSLHLQVDDEFTHEVSARLKADELLVFEGNGRISHKGMIETPLLEVASKFYEKSSEHHDNDIKRLLLKSTNDTFSIDEDATLTLDDFETEENTKGNISNKGDFTVKKSFINRRVFVNGGSFSAHTFSHKGASIANNAGGEVSITGDADLETDAAQNDGEWTFEGTLNGIIHQLINKSKGSLRFKKDIHVKGDMSLNQGTLISQGLFDWSGRHFQNAAGSTLSMKGDSEINTDTAENEGTWTFDKKLTGKIREFTNKAAGSLLFKKESHIKGDTFLNHGTLTAQDMFDWEGRHFTNTHHLFIYNNWLAASEQFYNTGFTRWYRNTVRAQHLLNMGYMERSSSFVTTADSIPTFTSHTLTETSFKPGVFENYGIHNTADDKGWVVTVGETKLQTLINRGTIHRNGGSLTALQSIHNNGLITAMSALTIESPHVQNTVTIAGKDAISVKTEHFDTSLGRTLSDKALDIQADRLSTNAQTVIRGDETVLVSVRDNYTNFGEIHGTKTTTLLGGKITNHGKIGGEDISFQNTVENYGTIHGTKATRLLGQKATNRGQISSPHLSIYHDIDNVGSIKSKRLDHYSATRITNQTGGEIIVDNYTSDQRLHEILNHGTFVIGSTDKFQVDTLNNHYTFSMQHGKYEISQVNNADTAEIHWTGGAHLLVGDMVNDGILKATANFRLIDMHNVRKLGKVYCGNKLIIETTSKTVNPSHFVAQASPHWQMKQLEINGELFNLQHRFISPVPLTLNVTNFTNQSLLQAPSLFLRSKTFQNGTGQSSFGDIRAEDEIDLTVEDSLYNQYGRINVGQFKQDAFTLNATNAAKIKAEKSTLKGRLTARSLTGAIHNGYYVGSGYYSMNGAYMSAGRSITLDAKTEVNNYFGELLSDDVMYLRAGTQISTTAGRTYSVGGMTWSAPVAVVTRNGGARKSYENINDSSYWTDQYRYYETSDGANILSGGDIHFNVDGLTIRGSKVTAFGKIYDKNRIERTESNLGYFRLESCSYGYHSTKKPGDKWPATDTGTHRTLGSTLSSATEVSFDFANNIITGAIIAAANLKMRGNHLTLGYTDASIDSGTTQLGKGARYSLAETINSLVGGAIRKLSPAENSTAVFGTGHSNRPGIAPDRVVIATANKIETILQNSEHNPELKRQLFDFTTMCFSLQATLLRNLNKGYLFAHDGLQEHLDKLTEAAITVSGNTMRMSLEQAANSDKPILTNTEELMDGESVLVPYITIPQAYINGDLAYNTGIVADGREDDDAVDIEMNRSLDQFSSLISGANRVKLHSKGTRRSETLKHAVHFHDRKTSGYKEIARAPAMVKSGGELIDTSISDFRSVGTARKASGNADVRSLEGNMISLPITLTQSSTTTTGGTGLFDATERTVTESGQIGFISDSIIAGGTILTGAGETSHYSAVAPHHIAAQRITYVGETGDIKGHVDVNSIRTETDGKLRCTSSFQEKPVMNPGLIITDDDVYFNFTKKGKATGVTISAHNLHDNTPHMSFLPQVTEIHESRSVEGSTGIGHYERGVEGGQEVVVPTVLNLSGKYHAHVDAEHFPGSATIMQAVRMTAPGGTLIEKELLDELPFETKSWQRTTDEKMGFSNPALSIVLAQNPAQALVDDAINNSVIGAVKAFDSAQDDFRKGVAGAKVANAAIKDGKALSKLGTPGGAKGVGMSMLTRFATISLSSQTTSTKMEAFKNLPNYIQTSWFQFDGKIWHHDGGAKLHARSVIVPNADLITMHAGADRASQSSVTESMGVDVNVYDWSQCGANLSNSKTTMRQVIHDHSTIDADYVFIRTKGMDMKGSTVRARIIDAMIEDDLLLESVVDEIEQTQKGISIAVNGNIASGGDALGKAAGIGDLSFTHKKKSRRWIEEFTSMIATEQLYLTVGKNFITRSAFAKREGADIDPDYYAINDNGQNQVFYEREMPIIDNTCAFYSFDLRGIAGNGGVRQEGVDLLLAHAENESIRHLVAFELMDKTLQGQLDAILPQAKIYHEQFQHAQKTLKSAVDTANAALGTSGLSAQQLLETDPSEKDARLIPVQLTLESLDTVKANIRGWAASMDAYCTYIAKYLGQTNVTLEYYNDTTSDRPMTGSMDALAHILGVDLKIFVKDETNPGKLILAHAFKGGEKPIHLVHVAYDPTEPHVLNHFNRLEESQDFTRATNRVEEHFDEEYGEVHTSEGYDITLPFATVATFAGNVVDGVKWLETAKHIRAHDESDKAKEIITTEARESGISEQETATIQQEVDSVYDDVAEANAIINSLKEKQEREQSAGKRSPQTKSSSEASDEPLLFASARSPSGQTPISRTSMSSKAATDKPLYGQTKTGFGQANSVPLTFDQPKQLANQQDEAAMVYALNKLSRATTKIESLGEQYPGIRSGLGFAAQVIEIGARTAYYVKMAGGGSAAGVAACGPLAANPYGAAVCSIGGGVVGLTAAFGTEQVIASGLEKGIEETSKAAGRQGRTAEESEKFEQSVQNTAFYLGALGSIFGAKKIAGNVKGGGKGKSVQFADEVPTKLPPLEKVKYDYSHPDAAFSSRIDPITGKGPMSIDSRDFTSATSRTVEGAARNKNQFWKLWSEKYPETMSEGNLKIITASQPKAPVVDYTWIQHFPEHQRYLGDQLIHHHIEQSHLVTGLPYTIHTKAPGRSIFHNNLGGKND